MRKQFLSIILPLILVLLMALLVTDGNVLGVAGKPVLTYHVHIAPGSPGRVEAVLEGVSGSSVYFGMDGVYGYEMGVDLVGNVFEVEAFGPGEVRLPLSREQRGWRVQTQGHSWVTLRYNFGVSLQEHRHTGSYLVLVKEEGAFFFNEAVFAYPNVSPVEIQVIFYKPEEWTIGTTFKPAGKDRFRVEPALDLRSGLLTNVTRMGVATEIVTKQCDDLELMYIFYPGDYEYFWYPYYGNTRREQMEKCLDLICDSINYYKEVFGFWPGSSRYWISTLPLGGYELSNFHHNVWMQPSLRERYSFFTHHLFHIWVWWSKEMPLRFTGAEESMWFNEGLATYYESELTARVTGDKMWLGSTYGHYLVMKRAAQFDLLDAHTINHYALGHMRALSMDRAIRAATGGSKGIDNLLALLGDRYGPVRTSLDRRQLLQAVNEVSGTDLSAFYNRYFTGRVSKEIPPVDDYIDEYRQPFLDWIDDFVSVPGNEARGSRTMFFISLELGIQSWNRPETDCYAVVNEHFVMTRSGVYNLSPFRQALSQVQHPLTEADVIAALTAITGACQSDFFKFYTVGDYRPCVKEIENWLIGAPIAEYEEPREDRSIAYMVPSTLQIGVPTEVKLVIVDPELVSGDNSVRIAVVSDSDGFLGQMLRGVQGHIEVANFEYQGVVTSFEYGNLPLEKTESGWEGTVTLTLPEDLIQVQIRATEESDYDYTLVVWLVDYPVEEEAEPVPDEREEEKVAATVIYYATGAALILMLVGVWFWNRNKKRQSKAGK